MFDAHWIPNQWWQSTSTTKYLVCPKRRDRQTISQDFACLDWIAITSVPWLRPPCLHNALSVWFPGSSQSRVWSVGLVKSPSNTCAPLYLGHPVDVHTPFICAVLSYPHHTSYPQKIPALISLHTPMFWQTMLQQHINDPLDSFSLLHLIGKNPIKDPQPGLVGSRLPC